MQVQNAIAELNAEIEKLKANPDVPDLSLEGLQAVATKISGIYEPAVG